MVGFLILVLQLLLLSFSSCNGIRNIKLVLMGKSDNFPLGSVIATSVLQNIYTCAMSCNDTSPCSSISFKKLSATGQGTCKLYGGSIILGPLPVVFPFPWVTYEFDSQSVTPPECPTGWDEYGESCYLLDTTYRNWLQSRDNCIALGAVLVDISSESENQFIMDLPVTYNYGNKEMWLGGHDRNIEGQWEWLSGQTMTFTKWNIHSNPPEPEGGTVENELAMYLTGFWMDLISDSTQFSVCEKPL